MNWKWEREEERFWVSEKSPLLCKVHRNRYSDEAVINNDKVRISYATLNPLTPNDSI